MDERDPEEGRLQPGQPKPETALRRFGGFISILVTIAGAVAAILSITHTLNARTAGIAVGIVVGITSLSTYLIERRK